MSIAFAPTAFPGGAGLTLAGRAAGFVEGIVI